MEEEGAKPVNKASKGEDAKEETDENESLATMSWERRTR
jgi:hypothetical protein